MNITKWIEAINPTMAHMYIVNTLSPAITVSVCLSVCVCVTYLFQDHWTVLVHIWVNDRYDTDW